MTTRAQLESERTALAYVADLVPADCESAVRASIARVEALLSLSDEACEHMVRSMAPLADTPGCQRPWWGTVANLIRREPRGDV